MRHLCLFGGSFDPVHLGHQAMLEAALGPGGQNEVWVVPAALPPHKPSGPVASPQERLTLLRLAFADRPDVRVSDLEIRRGGVSYTIDTVRSLRAELEHEGELTLLLGADSLPELPTWKEWKEILKLCQILVVPRPGVRPGLPENLAHQLSPLERSRLEMGILAVPPVAISSSEIRRRISRGEPWEGLVAPVVARRIQARSLYRSEP